MTTPRASTRRRKRTAGPSPEEYAEFVGQIQLESVWLDQCKASNDAGADAPETAEITFEPLTAQYELVDEGFVTYHEYGLQIQQDGDLLAEIMATFGVRFTSAQPMTDPLFELFKEVNLPVNTWPFFRELVHSTLGRFSWVPFALPAFKVGTPHDQTHEEQRSKQRAMKLGPRGRKPGAA